VPFAYTAISTTFFWRALIDRECTDLTGRQIGARVAEATSLESHDIVRVLEYEVARAFRNHGA
jgi:hypothetical protein